MMRIKQEGGGDPGGEETAIRYVQYAAAVKHQATHGRARSKLNIA